MKFEYSVEEIVERALKIYMGKNIIVNEISLDKDFVRIYSGREEIKVGVRNSDYIQLFTNLMELVSLYNVKEFSFDFDEKDKTLIESIVNEISFNKKCGLDYACKN